MRGGVGWFGLSGNVITGLGTDTDVDGDSVTVVEVSGLSANIAADVVGSSGGITVNRFMQTNDPDIFAVTDIWELLSRDMQGKARHFAQYRHDKAFPDDPQLMKRVEYLIRIDAVTHLL